MSSGTVIVPLRPGTDGDATHRPEGKAYSIVDPPSIYLEKVGTQWMNSRGEALPGVRYVLEALPAGYVLYERPRPSNPFHIDRFLYGHPSHKVFDSPNRFYPHFKYLMENQDSMGCPCTVCQTHSGRTTPSNPNPTLKPFQHGTQNGQNDGGPSRKVSLPIHKGRPKLIGPGMDTSRVDEEGTPDVYRNLIDKLKRSQALDEIIKEPMSMDWRAEQEIMTGMLKTLREQPQWVPRVGDIVLFVEELEAGVEICHDRKSNEFKLYNRNTRSFISYPSWKAGVVGQAPAEALKLDDLVVDTNKEWNVTYSGCRIEPLPNPNLKDKSISKCYKYVPVHCTRPFAFWREFMDPIPEQQWHPTIKNALTIMASLSLMGKHRFKGTWPSATIFSHGLYVGSEMIGVGDTVRLTPKTRDQACTDVLQIKSIRLKLTNLDLASDNDYDEGRPYNSAIYITGNGYTLDSSQASNAELPDDHSFPSILEGYGDWKPLHPPDKAIQIPFSRILGRCFESPAMFLWFPHLSPDDTNIPTPNLSQGLSGVQEARRYAKAHDNRLLLNFGTSWFWGDTRADALDLDTINGLEVGKFDTERNPGEWRKMIKVIDGTATDQERKALKQATLADRPLRGIMAPVVDVPTSGVQSAVDSMDDSSGDGVPMKGGKHKLSSSGSEESSSDADVLLIGEEAELAAKAAKKRSKVSVVIK